MADATRTQARAAGSGERKVTDGIRRRARAAWAIARRVAEEKAIGGRTIAKGVAERDLGGRERWTAQWCVNAVAKERGGESGRMVVGRRCGVGERERVKWVVMRPGERIR